MALEGAVAPVAVEKEVVEKEATININSVLRK